jgi:hypothetical protein
LFVDRLSWWQISELLFRWSGFRRKRYGLLRKVPAVLKSIRSPGDVRRYAIMFLVYLKIKLLGRVPAAP